jgi:hypothetical protein
MAIAILAAVAGLLVVGLVVAVWAAAQARRKFPLAFKPAPWSSDELDGLSSDLTDLGGHDPIAALARADSAANGGRSEPKPVTYRRGAPRLCRPPPASRSTTREEMCPSSSSWPAPDSSGPGPRPRCAKAGD